MARADGAIRKPVRRGDGVRPNFGFTINCSGLDEATACAVRDLGSQFSKMLQDIVAPIVGNFNSKGELLGQEEEEEVFGGCDWELVHTSNNFPASPNSDIWDKIVVTENGNYAVLITKGSVATELEAHLFKLQGFQSKETTPTALSTASVTIGSGYTVRDAKVRGSTVVVLTLDNFGGEDFLAQYDIDFENETISGTDTLKVSAGPSDLALGKRIYTIDNSGSGSNFHIYRYASTVESLAEVGGSPVSLSDDTNGIAPSYNNELLYIGQNDQVNIYEGTSLVDTIPISDAGGAIRRCDAFAVGEDIVVGMNNQDVWVFESNGGVLIEVGTMTLSASNSERLPKTMKILGDSALLVQSGDAADDIVFFCIDISDPENPVENTTFSVDSTNRSAQYYMPRAGVLNVLTYDSTNWTLLTYTNATADDLEGFPDKSYDEVISGKWNFLQQPEFNGDPITSERTNVPSIWLYGEL